MSIIGDKIHRIRDFRGMTSFLSGRDEKKTLLTVRSARPNIQNGSLTGRKRPMTAESMNLRKSGATYKPLEPQNNSV